MTADAESNIPVPDRVFSAVSTGETSTRTRAIPWVSVPGHVVDGGEIILLAVKPSMWRPLFDSAGWLFVASATALTLLLTGRSIPGLSPAATCQLIVSIGFVRLAFAIVRWVPTWYLLSNHRIIHWHGVRTPRIESRPLLEIRNTYLEVNPLERAAGVGTIRFAYTPPEGPAIVWQSVPNPEAVHSRIRRAIESAIDATQH